jgi:hypothetical protein
MSERINQIIRLIVCLIFLTECQNSMIPRAYMPQPSMAEKSSTGSWIVIQMQQDLPLSRPTEISGELIAIENDTVYLLTSSAFLKIHQGAVTTAVLYPFKPQSATVSFITGLSLLPTMIGAIIRPDPGVALLIIGIPLLVTGTIMSMNELYGNVMKYPLKYSLKDLGRFSRFPQGMPPDLDPGNLRLK